MQIEILKIVIVVVVIVSYVFLWNICFGRKEI